VYLSGYVLATDEAHAGWQQAIHYLQVGGERGYGWGRVEPVEVKSVENPSAQGGYPLFDGLYTMEPDIWPPVWKAGESTRLLAHALAADFYENGERRAAVGGVDGVVEPLVGRETTKKGRSGVRVSPARICYAPGSKVDVDAQFRIGPYGIWEAV
jgi:hypothetical protein